MGREVRSILNHQAACYDRAFELSLITMCLLVRGQALPIVESLAAFFDKNFVPRFLM